jgi:choline dehydrogenase-like flavoprotein
VIEAAQVSPSHDGLEENPSRYDTVVVGSGFGGSIVALRLAEAGKSVLVLERGRRYRPGEFPRMVTDVGYLKPVVLVFQYVAGIPLDVMQQMDRLEEAFPLMG